MFDEVLRAILTKVEGSRCIVLAGQDGVVVAAAGGEAGPASEAVAASLTALFREVAAAHRNARLVPPTELTTRGPSEQTALMEVTSGYVLIAVADGRASLGRLRFELRKAVEAFEPEIR